MCGSGMASLAQNTLILQELTFIRSYLSSTSCSQEMNCRALKRSRTDLFSSPCRTKQMFTKEHRYPHLSSTFQSFEEKYSQALVATDSVFVTIYRVGLSGTSFLCRSLVYSEEQMKASYKLCPPLQDHIKLAMAYLIYSFLEAKSNFPTLKRIAEKPEGMFCRLGSASLLAFPLCAAWAVSRPSLHFHHTILFVCDGLANKNQVLHCLTKGENLELEWLQQNRLLWYSWPISLDARAKPVKKFWNSPWPPVTQVFIQCPICISKESGRDCLLSFTFKSMLAWKAPVFCI